MSHTDLERLTDNALIHLPGCTTGALKVELFNVMTEFLNGSNCWVEDIPFRTRAQKRDYYITPASVGKIERLVCVLNPDLITVNAFMYTPGDLLLQYEPTSVQTLNAKVVLNVVDPVDRDNYPEFPEWVLQKYNLHILDGLLGRMMSQPVKPYSNERMAIYHTRKFRNGIGIAYREAKTANLYGGQNWKFPQNVAGRRR